MAAAAAPTPMMTGAPPSDFMGPSPVLHLLQLTPDSPLMMEGLPPECPCLVYSKETKESFQNAHSILSNLIADMGLVDFRDDPEWTKMPSVGAAIKRARAEETCFCVAVAPNKIWGVGISSGFKGRQPAAKLALAVALAMHADCIEALCAQYPEFGAMCAAAGLS